jgi:hypothetical protein
MIACGGGGGSNISKCTPITNTQPGTYTVTVTANSGQVSHTANVTLVVQ